MNIVIFAGCSTADDPPEGVTGYNMPKSAELAGAKVAIGWSEIQHGNRMNDWIDKFFEYMDATDSSTGNNYTAKRAFDLTNAFFTTDVSFSALYGQDKFFKFN